MNEYIQEGKHEYWIPIIRQKRLMQAMSKTKSRKNEVHEGTTLLKKKLIEKWIKEAEICEEASCFTLWHS